MSIRTRIQGCSCLHKNTCTLCTYQCTAPPPPPPLPGQGGAKMGRLTAFYCNNFPRGGAFDSTAYARGCSLVVHFSIYIRSRGGAIRVCGALLLFRTWCFIGCLSACVGTKVCPGFCWRKKSCREFLYWCRFREIDFDRCCESNISRSSFCQAGFFSSSER